MAVTIRFTQNTGPRFAPDSRVFGLYDRLVMNVSHDEAAALIGIRGKKGVTIAWEDFDGWYCDLDGEVYRELTVEAV